MAPNLAPHPLAGSQSAIQQGLISTATQRGRRARGRDDTTRLGDLGWIASGPAKRRETTESCVSRWPRRTSGSRERYHATACCTASGSGVGSRRPNAVWNLADFEDERGTELVGGLAQLAGHRGENGGVPDRTPAAATGIDPQWLRGMAPWRPGGEHTASMADPDAAFVYERAQLAAGDLADWTVDLADVASGACPTCGHQTTTNVQSMAVAQARELAPVPPVSCGSSSVSAGSGTPMVTRGI